MLHKIFTIEDVLQKTLLTVFYRNFCNRVRVIENFLQHRTYCREHSSCSYVQLVGEACQRGDATTWWGNSVYLVACLATATRQRSSSVCYSTASAIGGSQNCTGQRRLDGSMGSWSSKGWQRTWWRLGTSMRGDLSQWFRSCNIAVVAMREIATADPWSWRSWLVEEAAICRLIYSFSLNIN